MAENIEIDTSILNGRTEEEDIVTPWNVATRNETGIDYDKLISEFYREKLLKRISVIYNKITASLLFLFHRL